MAQRLPAAADWFDKSPYILPDLLINAAYIAQAYEDCQHVTCSSYGLSWCLPFPKWPCNHNRADGSLSSLDLSCSTSLHVHWTGSGILWHHVMTNRSLIYVRCSYVRKIVSMHIILTTGRGLESMGCNHIKAYKFKHECPASREKSWTVCNSKMIWVPLHESCGPA